MTCLNTHVKCSTICNLQEFPLKLKSPNFEDPTSLTLMPRSEVERRAVYFEKLEAKVPNGDQ